MQWSYVDNRIRIKDNRGVSNLTPHFTVHLNPRLDEVLGVTSPFTIQSGGVVIGTQDCLIKEELPVVWEVTLNQNDQTWTFFSRLCDKGRLLIVEQDIASDGNSSIRLTFQDPVSKRTLFQNEPIQLILLQ